MNPKPVTVTVLTKNDCSRCHLVKRKFNKVGIRHDVVNVEESDSLYTRFNDKTAMDFVINDLGIREMPVVIVDRDGERETWSGYDPTKMAALEEDIVSRGEQMTEAEKKAEQDQATNAGLPGERLAETQGSNH